MNTTFPLKSTLLTAAAALLCTGLQIAGIDSLATPRSTAADAQVVQLPTVLISAQRETSAAAVQQLPQVVVVGRRLEPVTATALGRDGAKGSTT